MMEVIQKSQLIISQNKQKVGDASSANVFFEHDELNADKHNHFHIIPQTILSDYKNYKNKIYNANGNEKR